MEYSLVNSAKICSTLSYFCQLRSDYSNPTVDPNTGVVLYTIIDIKYVR